MSYYTRSAPRRERKRSRRAPVQLREDVEGEVRESIYGWRSGNVERRGGELDSKGDHGPT